MMTGSSMGMERRFGRMLTEGSKGGLVPGERRDVVWGERLRGLHFQAEARNI
jgi:hypothetical protein